MKILPLTCLLGISLLAGGCAQLQGLLPGSTPSGQTAAKPADASKPKPNRWSPTMQDRLDGLQKIARETGISAARTEDDELQVNLPSDFSFDTDSANLKPQMRPVLDRFADSLETAVLTHLLVRVVGHTDDRGSDDVNLKLSKARAANVARYLQDKGIAASRIEVEGQGEADPVATNAQPYGRALNRRVDLFLREPHP